ncbi:MAG: glutamate-5-semialdehyde dehydrogenase [Bacillota bacterium]|nr:glutamate-5-semialdehyde dehydrogenase [Bacillota bacterium]
MKSLADTSMMDITRKMKEDSYKMAGLSYEKRNRILEEVAKALKDKSQEIFAANLDDMNRAEADNIDPAIKKRLKFDENKLADVLNGISDLIKIEDPVGKILIQRELDEGLLLKRISCPIGVIGIIFEARPDALVQISSLCIKSGNCAILKGGKETASTNKVLFDTIYEAATRDGAPEGCLAQAQGHSEIDELLACKDYVDLLIPRGSNSFVQYIMDNTKIPVMGHADGVCHTYVDKCADIDKAIPIIIDAKTQYTAACNATETLLVHRDIARTHMSYMAECLKAEGITLRGNREVQNMIEVDEMKDEEYNTEYLNTVLSIKIVDDLDEAIAHINRFGSHHTDAIITEDEARAEQFMNLVDSADVYWNCSTRFADGYRYGFGAEVGISTSKIHARGPVGLDGLVTYKYKLYGKGQIVGDYASGKKSFHFRDVD